MICDMGSFLIAGALDRDPKKPEDSNSQVAVVARPK